MIKVADYTIVSVRKFGSNILLEYQKNIELNAMDCVLMLCFSFT